MIEPPAHRPCSPRLIVVPGGRDAAPASPPTLRRAARKIKALLALAALLALLGCRREPPAPPPITTLTGWLEASAWPASAGAWRRVYGCQALDPEAAALSARTYEGSRCAFRAAERLCIADQLGAAEVVASCCPDPAAGGPEEALCRALEAAPGMREALELRRIYEAHPEALVGRYNFRGTTRDLDTGKVDEATAARVDALHAWAWDQEIGLMQERHRDLGGGLPLCAGQGNNWTYFCWKRYGLRGGVLVHYDSHADFAYNLDGYPFLLRAAGHAPEDPFWAEVTGREVGIDEFIQPSLVDGALHPTTTWIVPRWSRRYWPEASYHASLRLTQEGRLTSWSPDMDYDGIVHKNEELDAFVAECLDVGCWSGVDVTMRTVARLGEVTLPEGPVTLSVDLDYFGTIDTAGRGDLPAHCPDAGEEDALLKTFEEDLAGLPKPAVIAVALSPDFSCALWRRQLLGRVLAVMERRWGAM